MAFIDIDLVDGKPPVSFSLKTEDTMRFQAFMEKYHDLQKAVNAAHQRLDDMVAAGLIPMPKDLRATALGQCVESLRDELAPFVDEDV